VWVDEAEAEYVDVDDWRVRAERGTLEAEDAEVKDEPVESCVDDTEVGGVWNEADDVVDVLETGSGGLCDIWMGDRTYSAFCMVPPVSVRLGRLWMSRKSSCLDGLGPSA